MIFTPPHWLKYVIRLYSSLRHIGLIKTLYFNFKYFDKKTAFKLPFLLSRNVVLRKTAGSIEISGIPRTGMCRVGVSDIGIVDGKRERCVWEVGGKLILRGKADLGAGTRISIGSDGILDLGDNFTVSGRTTIDTNKLIKFGSDCMLSWDILMMDSDYHKIKDLNDRIISQPKPIVIGNHVWIGCRNTILKGVHLNDNVIVAAGSLVTRSLNDGNCIIGGTGNELRVIKQNINWER